jgi:hypothetical protein
LRINILRGRSHTHGLQVKENKYFGGQASKTISRRRGNESSVIPRVLCGGDVSLPGYKCEARIEASFDAIIDAMNSR